MTDKLFPKQLLAVFDCSPNGEDIWDYNSVMDLFRIDGEIDRRCNEGSMGGFPMQPYGDEYKEYYGRWLKGPVDIKELTDRYSHLIDNIDVREVTVGDGNVRKIYVYGDVLSKTTAVVPHLDGKRSFGYFGIKTMTCVDDRQLSHARSIITFDFLPLGLNY